jgi:hypothetical protein
VLRGAAPLLQHLTIVAASSEITEVALGPSLAAVQGLGGPGEAVGTMERPLGLPRQASNLLFADFLIWPAAVLSRLLLYISGLWWAQ